ncbi:hypothetical protein BB558_006565 [Smittium angustum]|uniref:Peptidase M1 leukotriene A4 hydrolase/aminopeptidase C-terminal domain-containing protein n=1 Tax=Smittium angustum TaxID=133377 RepID=A0A2U1IXB7_SMIAN|nr:hypothetical protein BB558_006565 [Smittium angustum]
MSTIDPNSLSNLSHITTNHLHLSLSVDFPRKLIHGHVLLSLQALAESSSLILDTTGLIIHSVQLVCPDSSPHLSFKFGNKHKFYGTPLEITLDRPYNKDESLKVRIDYQTTEDSGALQFLTPEQTKGKKHPFLFTQCQSIYARSLFPCQDSPSVKLSYSADLRVPKPFTGLMSAICTGSKDDGDHTIFTWEQTISVPSYLIVLACGNLVKHDIGPRTAVWAEPEFIDACAYEFADLEHIVSLGESIITPYVWKRYDLLILPPSFPYGGMENPCLTFVTPTMISGDRSLVDLISHELSHSWSGNLVTTRNWEHFWLNEGWTTFFERQITEKLSGRDTSQLLSVLGVDELKNDVNRMGVTNKLTNMVPNLTEVHPDDAFSTIPYEKGYNFLYYLQHMLGKDFWKSFYQAYVYKFTGKSIDTDDFKNFLYEFTSSNLGPQGVEKLDSVDWDSWLNKPGMPPVKNEFDSEPMQAPINLANKWISASNSGDYSQVTKKEFDNLSTHQKLVFFTDLKTRQEETPILSESALAAMDSTYGLSYNGNFEIRAAWLYLALGAKYKPVFDAAVSMVADQGRMKFTRPT